MTQEDVSAYLVDTYKPRAIALMGSRANDTAREGSDWDLVVFTGVLPNPEYRYEQYRGELLDIVFYAMPKQGHIIDTIWAPARSVKSLYDPSGILTDVIAATKQAYEQGPEPLSDLEKETLQLRLERFTQKAALSKTDVEAQYYTSFILANLITQAWFQLRREWPRPIHEATSYISEKDPTFYHALEAASQQGFPKLNDLLTALLH